MFHNKFPDYTTIFCKAKYVEEFRKYLDWEFQINSRDNPNGDIYLTIFEHTARIDSRVYLPHFKIINFIPRKIKLERILNENQSN
jgi:hypothetical protein